MMIFIQYPACSTCKKAKLWLDGENVPFTDRHIKELPPTYEELKHWYEASGLPLKRFFNTSGLAYKTLNLKDRLPTMTQEEQLRLLASDPMLVKRPILVTQKGVCPGFREEIWTSLLER